ncbi:unnamed protein product [marine sediment metagenome]|uniref:Uncharacterized protein n=1 Tax=marine sediment metagenome TaxID=412755 RepID=X1G7C5_9ZZZZ
MDEQEKLCILITPSQTIIGREGGKVLMDFAPFRIVVALPSGERLTIDELIKAYLMLSRMRVCDPSLVH